MIDTVKAVTKPLHMQAESDPRVLHEFLQEVEKIANGDEDQRLPHAIPAGEGRRAYYTRLVTACLWRRFVVTDDGHFGLAPRATRVGDVFVALRNGMWPFVLRPIDGAEGVERQYQFVGHAYLRGYMQGEIVQECRAGKRKIEQF